MDPSFWIRGPSSTGLEPQETLPARTGKVDRLGRLFGPGSAGPPLALSDRRLGRKRGMRDVGSPPPPPGIWSALLRWHQLRRQWGDAVPMPCHICVTCGVQHAESDRPPAACSICEDERQYVGWGGQRWTTVPDMAGRYRNQLDDQEPGLASLRTEPHFGIGQRAFLVQTPAGNLLWDCLSLIDEESVAALAERGGIDAIAISH